jgi:hypothetical protein
MRFNRDITSKWLLHAKGFMFLIAGLIAAGLILAGSPNLRTLVLLIITIWAFCRFYYYLFYVLERYVGKETRYAGILDALKYVVKSRAGARK